MSIVKMDELLSRALRRGYAVGYFEAWDLYSLEGVLEAAGNPRVWWSSHQSGVARRWGY
jgi:fructose/tagatose bisphosphate aldolase